MAVSPVSGNGALRIINSLHQTQRDSLVRLRQLSSGEVGSENPADLARAQRLDAREAGLRVAFENSVRAGGTLNTAQSAASGITEDLTRVKELLIQRENAGPSDKATIDEEINGLLDNIDKKAEGTKFDGNNLLNNSDTVSIQVGDQPEDTIEIRNQDLSLDALDLENLDLDDFEDAASRIDSAIDQTSQAQGRIAASQSRLDSAQRGLSNDIVAAASAKSLIGDIDVAEVLAKKTANDIKEKSAIALLAQANSDFSTVGRLLGLR